MMNDNWRKDRDKRVRVQEYIRQKEQNLIGVMKSVHIQWYLTSLSNIGFKVEIIHADLGFVTFLCTK